MRGNFVRLTVADVKKLAEELKSLPDVENEARQVTKIEAVKMMADQIALLYERGYSYEMIARILTQKGLSITVTSLKAYLARAKAEIRKRNKAAKNGNKKNNKLVTLEQGQTDHLNREKNEKSQEEKTFKSGFQVRGDSPDL